VSPLPAPADTAPVHPDSRAWAEAEIAEWLSEADEEAAAIIDRARAEALRCELAGHEELERLREEAVKVRMATAERVARRLNEARFEADQLLAEAGMQAEAMVGQARDLIRELVAGVEAAAGPGLLPETVCRLRDLLGADSLALPGRSGVLDLSGAVLLERPPAVVMDDAPPVMDDSPRVKDDTAALPSYQLVTPDGRAVSALDSFRAATPGRAPVTDIRLDRRPADTLPTLLALPVGTEQIDDIVPATPIRPAWWDRIVQRVRRAA